MKTALWIAMLTLVPLLGGTRSFVHSAPAPAPAAGDPWVMLYLAGWNYGPNGQFPLNDIEWGGFTHIINFTVNPTYDGTGNLRWDSLTPARRAEAVAAAHAHSKPILLCAGGWGNDTNWTMSIAPAVRTTFINNLVTMMHQEGYDGLDIDMEPINSSDYDNYKAFITELRAKLDTLTNPRYGRYLLTVATIYSWFGSRFHEIQDKLDRINIMSYDWANNSSMTWHNSPIYSGSSGRASADQAVNRFISSSVAPGKLGIGADFLGYLWAGGAGTDTGGATKPRQTWTTKPAFSGDYSYDSLMKNYYTPERDRWDAEAGAAYISIDNPGSVDDKMITYDNERTCAAKIQYCRDKGIGSVILWEAGGGYRGGEPAGKKHPLLTACKNALAAGGSGDTTPPTCSITSPVAGSTVLGTVAVLASASDNVGVTRIDLLVDGALKGSDTASPWQVDLNTTTLTNGSHSLVVRAFDAAGNSGSSASVSVSVNNPVVGDTTAPTCSLTSPAAGATVSNSVAVSANASDNVGVARVEFRVDGTLRSTDTTSPYGFSLDTTALSNGSHAIAAQSFDAAGNFSPASSVSVNVSNGGVGGSSTDLWISRDGLASGWSNASWNTTVNFANGSPVYAGASSISAATTSNWGGLSLRRSTTITNPSSYTAVEFYAHGGATSETLYVLLENAGSSSGLTQVNVGATTVNGWKKFSIPMGSLNPSNLAFDRIHIQSNIVDTYYVDEYRLVGTAGSDTIVPIVTITGPTSNATYTTSSSSITLTGSASDNVGVSSVSSSHGSVSGTTSWSNVVTLVAGTNVITITARDAAGNSATDSITVTYTPPDSTPPSLSVSSSASVTLSGSAADAGSGVASVSYSNAANGATGTASGTTSWSAVVPVVGGPNAITIKVTDGAGLVTSKVVTVNVTLP